jgi:hypothetical protein
MRTSQRRAAFGQVLDPVTLVSESGQVEAALAGERAADADLQRLQGLYHAEAASSLKMVQAAQSEQVRARTQYQAATSAFTAHWGALARLPAEQREQLIQHAASGNHLLIRASLLGRRALDVMPDAATLEVDGLVVPARVVGALPESAADLQTASLLLEVSAVPEGLGPGARVPVTLLSGERTGVWIPDGSLVYDAQGARVFRQLAAGAGGRWQYEGAPVELLQKQAAGWLVRGVTKEDLVVTGGVGALWTLQSANALSDNDDDD